MSRNRIILPFGVLLFIMAFTACEKNYVYEKNVTLRDHEWWRGEPVKFKVNVDDSTASYNLYLNLRHTDQYPKTNLWVEIATTYPSGKTVSRKEQIMVGSNEEQAWLGDCMSHICDFQEKLVEGLTLSEEGQFTFTIRQIMRTDPLPEVMSVGLRFEKQTVQR